MPPLEERSDQIILRYKKSPRHSQQPYVLARYGGMDCISLPTVAHPNLSDAVVEEFGNRLATKDLAEKMTDRIILCAGEAIGNAMRYGSPGSHVGCNLTIFGQHVRRIALLMVENLIPADFHPPLPAVDEVPGMEDLLATRGRGIAIMRDQSSAFTIVVNPGLSVFTSLLFLPEK